MSQSPEQSPSPEYRRAFDPTFWLATGLGAGLSPVMPGTVGSLWGLLLAWGLCHLASLPIQIGILAALFLIGIPLCTRVARGLGRDDPGSIVYDEIVTVPVVFLFLPQADLARPLVLILGFLLHRLFDISKPPPIRRLEKVGGGLGIMIDDLLAAVYAAIVFRVILNLGWI
jgi:phosphatidylglycerophosphatase A